MIATELIKSMRKYVQWVKDNEWTHHRNLDFHFCDECKRMEDEGHSEECNKGQLLQHFNKTENGTQEVAAEAKQANHAE